MEKIVLLAANLESSRYLQRLKTFIFPKAIKSSIYYPFLEFCKLDKQTELSRLESIEKVTPRSLNNAYQAIKADIWACLYQKEIEKLFMEKVVWSVGVKKAAGM